MQVRVYHFLWKVDPFTSCIKKSYIKFILKPTTIKRIVIGPSKDQEKTLDKVQSFLYGCSPVYDHVEVYRSTIPYVEKENN